MKITFAAIMVWFSAALWINYVQGQSGETIVFKLCSAKTCKEAVAAQLHIPGTTLKVKASDIHIIGSVDTCPNCTDITLSERGHSAIVIGSPTNWACRIWGGMHCVVRKEQND